MTLAKQQYSMASGVVWGILAGGVVVIILVFACSPSLRADLAQELPVNHPSDIELSVINWNGRFGYIDRTGEIRIPFRDGSGGFFSSGLARFVIDLKCGYLNPVGDVVINPSYFKAGDFSGNRAFAQRDKSDKDIAVINRVGSVVHRFKDVILLDTIGPYAVVRKDQKSGVLNVAGEWVLPPRYLWVGVVGDNMFSVLQDNGGEKRFAIVGRDGNVHIPPKYTNIGQFDTYGIPPALAPAQVEDGWGFVDIQGNFVIAPQFTSAGPFFEGLARVENRSRQHGIGFIDKQGHWVIPPDYEYAEDFSESRAPVARRLENGKVEWGYIDPKGKRVIDFQFDSASPFRNGVARVLLNNRVCCIDKSGGILWQSGQDVGPGLR